MNLNIFVQQPMNMCVTNTVRHLLDMPDEGFSSSLLRFKSSEDDQGMYLEITMNL